MASGTIPNEFADSTGTITAASGITLDNSNCVKSGNVVSIFCQVSGDFALNGVLATLPSGFRPKQVQRLLCRYISGGNDGFYFVRVLADGTIDIRYSNTHATQLLFSGTIVL